jgi:hypothetical protein
MFALLSSFRAVDQMRHDILKYAIPSLSEVCRVWPRRHDTLGNGRKSDDTTPKVPRTAHGAHMADSEEEPVMLPFADKVGTGWHVVIRYHKGHERRIEGFTTEKEALEWIVANSKQVDE